MRVKRVCVIGAGISGLVAAKTFIKEGYEVTVFEKQKSLGGVWEKSRTYPSLTTQNPRDTYAFSDYPMPASYPEWPTAEQVQTYLESYAKHFNVMPKIHFQAEVVSIDKQNAPQIGWVVSVKFLDTNAAKNQLEKYEFDFVLVCNGIYNVPKIPSFPGQEEFIAAGGKILHSTNFNDPAEIKGKRVVVVGFGKSALDIVTVAAQQASESTLVFRKASWKVPRLFFGLINLKYIVLTRFSEAWWNYRHLEGIEKLLHTIGKPLVWSFWRINETIVRLQLGLDDCKMLPDHPINKEVSCNSFALAPVDFFKYVRSGKIKSFKTAIAKFNPRGLELANGEKLQADIVIFGTGFRQEISFLPEKYHQMLIDKQGNFHLYRHLIHPDIPQMGFVGYNSSLYCQLTSEVGAKWLVEYVKGNLVLPSPSEMHNEITANLQWWHTQRPFSENNGTCVAPFGFHHIEELLNDLGVKHHTNGWQKIKEVMMPLDPSIYKNKLA